MAFMDAVWRYDRIILPVAAFLVGFIVANPGSDAQKASVLESDTEVAAFSEAYQTQIDSLNTDLTETRTELEDTQAENGNLTDIIEEFSVDQDSDGLPDYFETVIGTSTTKDDSDGDGFPDLIEIQAGFSPLVASNTQGTAAVKPVTIADEPPAISSAPDIECLIKGSENNIYHLPGSKYYDQTEDVKEWFCTLEEALAAGYRPPLK